MSARFARGSRYQRAALACGCLDGARESRDSARRRRCDRRPACHVVNAYQYRCTRRRPPYSRVRLVPVTLIAQVRMGSETVTGWTRLPARPRAPATVRVYKARRCGMAEGARVGAAPRNAGPLKCTGTLKVCTARADASGVRAP